MKYCNNCGEQMHDEMKFCNACGAESGTVIVEKRNVYTEPDIIPEQQEARTMSGNKHRGCLMIILWIALLPLMAIYTIIKSEKLNKPTKIILVSFIVLFCIAYYAVNYNGVEQNPDQANIDNSKQTEPISKATPGEKQTPEPELKPKEEAKDIKSEAEIPSQHEAVQTESDEVIEQTEPPTGDNQAETDELINEKPIEEKNADIINASITNQKNAVGELTELLSQVGCKEIVDIKVLSDNSNSVEFLTKDTDDVYLSIALSKEQVSRIIFGANIANTLYIRGEGVICVIGDFILPKGQIMEYIGNAETHIKKFVEGSTPFLPSEYSVSRFQNYIFVSSKITGRNAFGREISKPFTVKFTMDNNELVWVSVDGKTVFGKQYESD